MIAYPVMRLDALFTQNESFHSTIIAILIFSVLYSSDKLTSYTSSTHSKAYFADKSMVFQTIEGTKFFTRAVVRTGDSPRLMFIPGFE